ncbi:MAG TPA: hypothetical protein VE622_02240 [Nitrososphaeraceae archaeon]|jgi:hypothetical protein|nr:hypothetical protein [Nitrososphaeraceae archaeon]
MKNVKAIKKDIKKTKKTAIRKKQKPLKKNKPIKMAILKIKKPTIKKKGSVRLRKSKITSDKKVIPKRKAAISAGKKKITASVATGRTKRAITIDKKPVIKSKIVRIMGQGQFTVDSKTLKKLDEIDNSIVQLVSNERSNDTEFRRRLTELTDIVTKNGKPLHPKEIIQSDIILPSTDLSIDEAKNLFKSEGVIPEI